MTIQLKKSTAGLFLFLLLAIPAIADQIVLKNGDRLTGTITKSDGKVLVIKTDYAGDVTVKFDVLQSITSTGDLNITLSGKTVVGPVTTNGDDVVVATKAAGPVEAPKASVTMLRNPAEEAAYEKSLHPGLLEGWNGGLNLGFAVTTGNSETKSLNIAFSAARTGLHDKLILYTNSIYAVNDNTSPASTTANSIGGGARYDHDFAGRSFGFVNGDFFSNSLQELTLRSTLGGGAGLHVIKDAATTFDLLLGLNYTHESYASFMVPVVPPTTPPTTTLYPAVTHSLAALTLGENLTHKFGKSTVLTQSWFLFPDLSETGEVRSVFAMGTVTKLNKWLAWQNTFGDTYVTNPPPTKLRNDLQLATGVSFTFVH